MYADTASAACPPHRGCLEIWELEEWESPEIRTLSHIQERMLDPEPEGASKEGWTLVDFVKKRRRQGEVKKAKKEKAQELRIIRTIEPETVNSVTTKNNWEVIHFAVDSGASETVISEDMLPNIPIKQVDASRRGVQNEVDNGVRIPNLGEKKVQGSSEDGTVRSITTQVCEVNKGLLSVRKVVEAGNRVVFDSTGSYIEDKKTHERMYMRDEAGMYMLRCTSGTPRVRVFSCGAPNNEVAAENEIIEEFEPEDEDNRKEGEEAEEPRGLRAPLKVSKEQRDAHEITHTPYRAWCRHCVRARGGNAPHRTRTEEQCERQVPKVSVDYFFMSQADEKEDKNPLIVMVDESTGEKYARAVGKKGTGEENEMEWLVKDMSEEMKSWGHQGGDGGHIILKGDGERSIVALRTALAKFHGGKVVPEDPPRGESQSNGTFEEAGKTVREFVRVLREHVQDKAEVERGASDVIVLWMVRWAAMMVSRFLVGKDGLTAYERRRGRKCRIPVVAFGEKVWYKEIRPGKERANKLESEWREGLWLGHSRRSNEAIIGTA